MATKLELELRSCHNCVIVSLMKRHGMTIKRPKTPIIVNTKKIKEWNNVCVKGQNQKW
jgi:hypothetical protein